MKRGVRESVAVSAVLLAALFLSFNTQNLVADVFFWLFPVMALTERVLPRLKAPGAAGGK